VFLKLVSENAFLGFQGDILFAGLDARRDKVFVHTCAHVVVRSLGHAFFVDTRSSLCKRILKLLKARVNLEDGTFSLNFLLIKGPDLLFHVLQVNLLLVNSLVSVVVLFLNLSKLDRHFTNLLRIVLLGRSIVCRVKQRVHVNEATRAIVDLKLFGHHLFKVGRRFCHLIVTVIPIKY
jgi:hypothetical protein